MNTDTIKEILLCSLAINYGVFIIWSAVFILAHDWMYRLHSRWFKISVETFDALHYAGMAVYKIGIFLLNFAPLIAFWLVF